MSSLLNPYMFAASLPTPDYDSGSSPFNTSGWVAQNATHISVSTSGITFKCTAATDSVDNIAYDLQNVLGAGVNADNSTWSLRYTVTYNGAAAGAAGENHFIGIGDLDGAIGSMANPYPSAPYNVPENSISFAWADYFGTSEIGIASRNGWYSNGYPDNTAHTTSANLDITGTVKYYITLMRHTATKVTMNIRENSHTDPSVTGYPVTSQNPPATDGVYGNATPTSSIISLRYLKIWNRAKEGTRTGYLSGVVHDMQFWNGIEIE
jgi:hypothetical protein